MGGREERDAAKRKAEEEAKARIKSIVDQCVQGERLQVFGIAYWDSNILGKPMRAALMGWMAFGMSGGSHHAGILAVTETRLHVIETAAIVGDKVNAFDVLGISAPGGARTPEDTTAYLKDLLVRDRRPGSGTLSITGAIKMEAKFPPSYEMGNASKADQIAAAIKSARGSRKAG